MDFEEWEPIYERILQDFGFDRGDDVRARDVLAGYVEPFDLDRLPLDGKTVAIAGGSPTLSEHLDTVHDADVVIASSTAADVLLEANALIDLMVTDLDGCPETAIALSRAGVPVAVHAHGDNVNSLRRYLPGFDVSNVLGTTQSAPVYGVENFGGFTDGDRGAFLADHLGATRLVFPGWDFDDTTVSRSKRRKLAWAERLLLLLERRRGERFELLEGRRDRIRSL
ncbi:MAG: 6-hydroxymethylpterin diphosphokinase MptE-like protein [Halodesulfurarchaeum sp.]